jgi:hypothetical protein
LAILSSLINNAPIIPFQIIQLAIPLGFGLSFLFVFSKKDINKVLLAITLYGFVNVFFSYAIFLFGLKGMEMNFPISGLFTDRNGFGKYLTIVNVIILIEFVLQKNILKRVLLGMVILLIFVGILIQYSRSGYIAYFVSTSIIIFMGGSRSLKKIALVFLPIILLLFTLFTISRIHSEKMSEANMSDIGRLYVAKAGINMIMAHPMRGLGFRNSELHIQDYADQNIPGLDGLVTIHNWFITVWAEMGIAGFLVFCSLNLSLMYACLKHFRKRGLADGKHALFSFNALLILMIAAQLGPNYDYESIYWIVVAIAVISLEKFKHTAVQL